MQLSKSLFVALSLLMLPAAAFAQAPLEGVVTWFTESGAELQNVSVSVRSEDGSVVVDPPKITDSEGRYVTNDLLPGTYTVTFALVPPPRDWLGRIKARFYDEVSVKVTVPDDVSDSVKQNATLSIDVRIWFLRLIASVFIGLLCLLVIPLSSRQWQLRRMRKAITAVGRAGVLTAGHLSRVEQEALEAPLIRTGRWSRTFWSPFLNQWRELYDDTTRRAEEPLDFFDCCTQERVIHRHCLASLTSRFGVTRRSCSCMGVSGTDMAVICSGGQNPTGCSGARRLIAIGLSMPGHLKSCGRVAGEQ